MNTPTAKKIVEMAKAGYPALYLLTPEDGRAMTEIKKAASDLSRNIFTWTLGRGVVDESSEKNRKPIDDTETPNGLLSWLPKMKAQSILVLRLFHHFLEDPLVQSSILDILPQFKNASQRQIIITTPVQKIPQEIEKEIALIEMVLPDKEALGEVLDSIVKGSGLKGDTVPNEELRKQLVTNASGMTTGEAENAFALALIRGKGTAKKWDPDVVMTEKCATLKKTGLLEFIPTTKNGMGNVGGMKNLKGWAKRRKKAWSQEAKDFGLDKPKGILMVGIPGTGKSLASKALAQEWGLPLLRLDMGKMLGSLVGQSEANMRMALQIMEAVQPCIGWIDEVEKGLAGSGSGGSLDSGVGARILGTLLTWMQENDAEVFICATANDVSSLPPELLRKGRFDEMFSVMLPNDEERKEIFRIHLEKRGRGKLIGTGLDKLSLDQLVKRSEGFSGAEIEAVVKEALITAFDSGRDLKQEDLINVIDDTVPLSKSMGEKLGRMIEWCKDRTRSANGDDLLAAASMPAGRMVDA